MERILLALERICSSLLRIQSARLTHQSCARNNLIKSCEAGHGNEHVLWGKDVMFKDHANKMVSSVLP